MLIADRYRVVGRLGAGGAASVSLAEDQTLGRQVALKRFYAVDDPDAVKRFTREAKLGASLSHPNVVSVYDALEEEEGQVILVLEYVEGESLAQALEHGRIGTNRALEILEPLAEALDHAHENGVVHRDVKPANILLRRDGVVKLADLGVATSVHDTRITREGTALGTIAYMAPEQLSDGNVTAAADTYALALVAYEMLSGRPVREGDSPAAVMQGMASESTPADLRDAWPQAPSQAAEAIQRALDPDPAKRPDSAGEFVRELQSALSGDPSPNDRQHPAPQVRQPSPAPPTSNKPPRKRGPRRWRAIFLLIGLLIGGGAVLVALGDRGGGDQPASNQEGEVASASGDSAPAGTDAAPSGSPAAVVEGFYELAASGDYDAAWALAGPGARSQFGGRATFEGTFATLESIEFERAEVVSETTDSATVEIETVATHTDHVDTCSGQTSLVSGGEEGWLIERIGVDCG